MPRMRDPNIARTSVSSTLPPASSTKLLEMVSPSPVRDDVPITNPTMAQAMATPRADLAPASRAASILAGPIRVSFRRQLTAITLKVPQKAENTGVLPVTSRNITTMIGTTRCPLAFITVFISGSISLGSPFSFSFFAIR